MTDSEVNSMIEKFQYASLSRGNVVKILIVLNQVNIITYEQMCDMIHEISPLDNI
jgi:hypothetical protein